MLVKICNLTEEISPYILTTQHMGINELIDLIDQIKKYGISLETTNVRFNFVHCEYALFLAETENDRELYFKIYVEETY